MRHQSSKIGFIGTGVMGAMLIQALLREGKVAPANLWASNRNPVKLAPLTAEFNGLHTADADTVAEETQILFVCVKPADTGAVLRQIHDRLREEQICVFLTNVFTFQQLEAQIPCRLAKLIPSITQKISRGIALLAYGTRVRTADSTVLEKLLSAISKPLVVPENQLRLFADVTSCGPAFLSACIQELCLQAANKADYLSLSDLREAAIETLGATAEMLRAEISPKELVRQVAVPGGMTEAGLQALRGYLPQAVAAVLAATQQAEQQKRKTLPLNLRK